MGKDWNDNRGYLPGVDGFLDKYVWEPGGKFRNRAEAAKQRAEDLKQQAKLAERAKQSLANKARKVIQGDKCRHEFATDKEKKKRKGLCVNCGSRVM